MDNNNNKPIDQTPPTPATPVQPSAFPNAPSDPLLPQEPKITSAELGQPPKKSKINIWIAGGVVILVVILTGVYFYLSQTAKTPPTTPTTQPVSQPQEEDLESELNSLDVESEGADFAEVDKDLQSL